MTALLLLAALGAAAPAPCEAPPVGMVCVPGGPAVLGADDKTEAEKPRHSAVLPTYYLDRTEVTNADYERCAKTGACPPKWGRVAKSYGAFLGPKQPALPMSWDMANAYCVWAGKRLPTEAEWEKAARGGDARTYPWGEDPPSCDKANYKGCPGNLTKPVGSLPAGPYGTFDLASNGYEWVQDYWTESYAACGAACQGDDPRGAYLAGQQVAGRRLDLLWRRCFCAAQGGEKTADAGIGILCQQIVVAGQFLGQGFAKCFECVELVLPELEG